MLNQVPTPTAFVTHQPGCGLTSRLPLVDHATIRREGWAVVERCHDPDHGRRVQLRPVVEMPDGSPAVGADHEA